MHAGWKCMQDVSSCKLPQVEDSDTIINMQASDKIAFFVALFFLFFKIFPRVTAPLTLDAKMLAN